MMVTHTQFVLLGTGTPRPDPTRFGQAAAVIVNGSSYLIDCGPGIVRRAAAMRAKGIEELASPKLSHVFITHLHSDHTLGYPDLIFSPWVVGRKDALEAYGPKGLRAMTDHLIAAYSEDVEVRTHGLEHGNQTGYKVHVHEVEQGVIYEDANVRVTAIPVKHGSWKHAFGYRFDTADRSIVFSGDTAPCEALEQAATGVDILVHEVYEASEAVPEQRPGGNDWPTYMRAYHTSAIELGQMAGRCYPKKLILNHVLMRHGSEAQLISEM